jgi:hypothetical protein
MLAMAAKRLTYDLREQLAIKGRRDSYSDLDTQEVENEQ